MIMISLLQCSTTNYESLTTYKFRWHEFTLDKTVPSPLRKHLKEQKGAYIENAQSSLYKGYVEES